MWGRVALTQAKRLAFYQTLLGRSRAMRLTQEADPVEFFSKLYAQTEKGCLEVRGIDMLERLSKRSVSHWFSLDRGSSRYPFEQAIKYAKLINDAGYDVFFGVNPRVRGGQEDDDVLACVALWCDIDNLPTPAEAEEKLNWVTDCKPLSVDAAVFSGGGLHLYWVLKEPIDPAGDDYTLYLQALRATSRSYGGDSKCCNSSRVLRFPLSFSHKRGAQTLLWVRDG
jgi:hypothetical protein